MRLATWQMHGFDVVMDITGTPEAEHAFGCAEKFEVFDILVSY